jgi:hypothetical protein
VAVGSAVVQCPALPELEGAESEEEAASEVEERGGDEGGGFMCKS